MLKRLDIQGFKSFANKVQIEFNPGLTVVVGPNGSGKSNIADAINWALGEQRASALRGSRMDEVIFAGSEHHRRMGMCEVSLVLDNSKNIFPLDYSEITITRRIFRSGESQYMINKVPCRLKDIHNLLMDTGIGRGAYAIIGQGKVEEILHSRPEERRFVIEEAAGIVKYRRRKEEAQRKLASTEQDLARLGDIINELSERLKPLEVEAKKAEQWKKYVKERRQLELEVLGRELVGIQRKLFNLNEQLKSISQNENKECNQQVSAEAERLNNKLKEKNRQIDEHTAQLEKLRSEIQAEESRLLLIRDRYQNNQQEYKRTKEKREEAEKKLQKLKNDINQQKDSLNKLRASVNPNQSKLQEMEQSLKQLENEIKVKESALEEDKAQIIELMNLAAQGKAQLQRAEERKNTAERRLTQLRQAAQDASLEQVRLKEKLKEVRKEIKLLSESISSRQKELTSAEQQRRKLNQELYRHQDNLHRLREQLAEARSRYRVLEESQENYAGYQRGVKEVLLALKMGKVNLKGICGTVAELLKVPAHLEVAVETALGAAVQNIVTKTDIDARNVIDYLKKNKLGRVTFLPLNTLRPLKRHVIETQALSMPGVIGIAADLVQCPPEYSVVKEFLLGKVLIVENIDFGLEVARATNHRVRLVTLDGELLHPGGSITGGSSSQQSRGLLKAKRQKNEYAQKVEKLKEMEEEYKETEKNLQKEINLVEQQIDELRDMLVKQQVFLAGKEQEQVQLEDAVARYGYRSQENSYEINNLEEEIKHQDQVQEKAARQVAEADNKLDLLKKEIEEKQHILTKLKGQQHELQQKITSFRVELAGVEQQEAGILSLLERLNLEISSCRKEIKTIDNELISIKKREEQLREEKNNREEQLNNLKIQKDELDKILQNEKKEQQEITRRVEEIQLKLKEIEKEEREYREKIHKIQLQQARLETEKQALVERLERDYNVKDLSKLRPAENLLVCKNRIEELKNLIDELGPVNHTAEEEYKKVYERYNYLLHQKEDLDSSKHSLQNIIKEMDSLMSSRFQKSLKKIQEEFSVIFKELFGGGTASIHMLGDDPLTAGIDIEARPPGKKLQNISLLSGGERSLTAIALLFAVLKVSPSPFCVLDEIDAALDESNVDRFAEFLLKFSQNTQFVVISHRKGTMERAETLYGVTMGNTGVSKVFSIELSKAEAAISKS
ncbi:MAG: chromosome segregation protein SMC [Desulfotomaculum sp.]|nr:chromosome segregation protein SMC [Desulfotomaculum sp.]